jgi:predicted DNA-binding protein
MESKLTKIQRFRFSNDTVEKLDKLSGYGLNKSKFVRDAINEKLSRELPEICKPKKEYCPF